MKKHARKRIKERALYNKGLVSKHAKNIVKRMPHDVAFEVPTAVVLNVAILWDTALYIPYVNRCFGGKHHLIFRVKDQLSNKSACSMWLGDMCLQNIGSCTDYMALYPRRWQRSYAL
jgi:hypothetical protein